jgi:hypothetical protein
MRVNDCPLVLVEWVDSQTEANWTLWDDIKEPKEPLIVYTVGWLVHKNDANLLVVSTVIPDKDKQATQLITIPLIAVNWIKEGKKVLYKRKK